MVARQRSDRNFSANTAMPIRKNWYGPIRRGWAMFIARAIEVGDAPGAMRASSFHEFLNLHLFRAC
jgi:hypothetical protein